MTDLSKAFDCIDYKPLIAKMHAYGFNIKYSIFIDSYLARRKQRVNINSPFSEWSEVHSGVPQGSVLGPLVLNIYGMLC